MKNNSIEYGNEVVSVIMPAYQSEATIACSIESVLSQTYENWELLVYDDCSTDGTLEITRGYVGKDKRIVVISGKVNTGVASARNQAIEMAAGRYISFLDSDDRWEKGKLEKQIKYMNEHGCGMCYSAYELLDKTGKKTGRIVGLRNHVADYDSLLRNNYIGTLTVIMDRSVIKKEDIHFSSERHEDYLLWLELVKKGYKIMGMDESLAYYRVSENSLSGNKLKAACWRWRAYYRIEKLGIFRSLFFMIVYTINSISKRIVA